MRTISETIDNETYIDLIIDPTEVQELHDQSIEPVRLIVNGIILNLWVRTATARELYGDDQYFDDE